MTPLEVVPPGAFRPPPAVESAVIRIDFRAAPRVVVSRRGRCSRSVVRAAFGQRRKTLGNALRGGGLGAPERIAAALAEAAIDRGRRAETLSLEEFARPLADALPLVAAAPSSRARRLPRIGLRRPRRGFWGRSEAA